MSAIKGNHGMGVYLRETGYMVEWFSLSTDPTTIIDKKGPFETRHEAESAQREWRRSLEEAR